MCEITLNDIRTDGSQDEERERDCPIKKRKVGKWIEHSFSEDGKTRLIECSECGAAYTVNCLCDYSIFVEERRYCNKCGAKMDGFRLTFVEEQNCEGHVACSVVYSDVMEGALLELPSAQPEIIRCKDCKHRDVEKGFCEGRGWLMQLVPDNGFCDKGERGCVRRVDEKAELP